MSAPHEHSRQVYRITFPFDGLRESNLAHAELQELLSALVAADMLYLRAHPEVPPLSTVMAQGRVRYADDVLPKLRLPLPHTQERWQDIPTILETSQGGNRDLAAWRAAELRLRGTAAEARLVQRKGFFSDAYRAVVVLPSGAIEDPARGAGWADVRGRHRIEVVLALFDGHRERDLSNATLDVLLTALTRINVRYLQAHPETPLLRDANIRYEEEPPGQEDWQDIPTCLRMGSADCEDLAAWLAAEYQVRFGVPAHAFYKAFTKKDGGLLYHILVRRPDGRVEDPSRAKGMR